MSRPFILGGFAFVLALYSTVVGMAINNAQRFSNVHSCPQAMTFFHRQVITGILIVLLARVFTIPIPDYSALKISASLRRESISASMRIKPTLLINVLTLKFPGLEKLTNSSGHIYHGLGDLLELADDCIPKPEELMLWPSQSLQESSSEEEALVV